MKCGSFFFFHFTFFSCLFSSPFPFFLFPFFLSFTVMFTFFLFLLYIGNAFCSSLQSLHILNSCVQSLRSIRLCIHLTTLTLAVCTALNRDELQHITDLEYLVMKDKKGEGESPELSRTFEFVLTFFLMKEFLEVRNTPQLSFEVLRNAKWRYSLSSFSGWYSDQRTYSDEEIKVIASFAQ